MEMQEPDIKVCGKEFIVIVEFLEKYRKYLAIAVGPLPKSGARIIDVFATASGNTRKETISSLKINIRERLD
jgi:hypothetical protein